MYVLEVGEKDYCLNGILRKVYLFFFVLHIFVTELKIENNL